MIWIVFGAMAVATFLSVGRILADADPRGSRAPIRAMAFVVWVAGLLLTLSGKVLIGLGVMAVGAFGLGAVSSGVAGRGRAGRRPNSGFGEGDRRGGTARGGPHFEANADPRAGRGRFDRRTGVMTEEEAYQVLGLQPGATAEEVARAHRTLMKKVHPDQGGTTELAARVNAAKDVLVAKSHG